VKKFVGKITEIEPLYLILAGVLVGVLIIAGIFMLVVGGDESDGPNPTLGIGEGDSSQLPGGKRKPPRQAPVVRTGVLDEARRSGRLAVAQARGTVLEPSRVRIRVGATPRQTVTVNYQLGCYRNRRAKVGRGSYRTRPPDTRAVPIPMSGAKTCIVTAGAQLTKVLSSGTINVQVIAG
jgi:hypothetical protein